MGRNHDVHVDREIARNEEGNVSKDARHTPGPSGQHLYFNDGAEPFIQATYAAQPCGCRVVGAGTLQHPLDIRRCPVHAAAPDLVEALRLTVAQLDDAVQGYDERNRFEPVEDTLTRARAALAKAGR